MEGYAARGDTGAACTVEKCLSGGQLRAFERWSQRLNNSAIAHGVTAAGVDQCIESARQRRQIGNLARDHIGCWLAMTSTGWRYLPLQERPVAVHRNTDGSIVIRFCPGLPDHR